ncbi:MAG: Rrf2 family transcriptional regulator [Pseudomonadota bacterium]
MRLNRATDFAIRVLMFLAAEDEPASIDKIADILGLAKSNTMKIVARLSTEGIVTAQRGRGGGVSLKTPADKISIGTIVRLFETDFAIVDCFNPKAETCAYEPRCALKHKLNQATQAFLTTLDEALLSDIVSNSQRPIRHLD